MASKWFCSPSGQLHRCLDLILPDHSVCAIIGWTDAVSISTSDQPMFVSLCCRLCSSVEPTLFKYVRRINRWVIPCCVLRCFFTFASALVHALFLGVFSVGVTLHSYSTRHLGLEGLGVHLGLDQIASSGEIFIWLPFTPLWSTFRSLTKSTKWDFHQQSIWKYDVFDDSNWQIESICHGKSSKIYIILPLLVKILYRRLVKKSFTDRNPKTTQKVAYILDE